MKGTYTSVNDIRKSVFAAIAELSYNYKEGDLAKLSSLPYEIIPGEVAEHRESVFLERAIVTERLRLAMGLNFRSAAEYGEITDGAEEAIKPEKYYQPPLINIIKFACHACPDNVIRVTDQCQGCLAHPCKEVCPKGAISIYGGRSHIDQEKCIKCGKCIAACPYGSIMRMERPCRKACGMDAIHSDQYGRADIDQEKCVSCGMCLVNCPFGAIADKSQIFQTIQAIKGDAPVYAAVAPAAAGQFSKDLTPKKLRGAFKALGFADAVEVAIGADLCTMQEAEMFINEVPSKLPFMATSCCPSWSVMAKKLFPAQADCVSMALTPMVMVGRLIKKEHPGCKVAFIGPCASKKLEASRKSVRSDIDFVLTFEEVMGMFEAKQVDFAQIPEDDSMHGASGDGRGFAVPGGVANAVKACIENIAPGVEVPIARAEGLADCRKMMMVAKAGKYNGYLLEGMACPGGCAGGAGSVQPAAKTAQAVAKAVAGSTYTHAYETKFSGRLTDVEE